MKPTGTFGSIWQRRASFAFLEYKVKSQRAHRGGATVQAGVRNSAEAEWCALDADGVEDGGRECWEQVEFLCSTILPLGMRFLRKVSVTLPRKGPVCLHPLRQGKQELTFPAGAGWLHLILPSILRPQHPMAWGNLGFSQSCVKCT